MQSVLRNINIFFTTRDISYFRTQHQKQTDFIKYTRLEKKNSTMKFNCLRFLSINLPSED